MPYMQNILKKQKEKNSLKKPKKKAKKHHHHHHMVTYIHIYMTEEKDLLDKAKYVLDDTQIYIFLPFFFWKIKIKKKENQWELMMNSVVEFLYNSDINLKLFKTSYLFQLK